MNKKRSATSVLVTIAAIAILLTLLILPARESFDSPVLHYIGDDKIMGCLYVTRIDAHGHEVKDRGACQSYSQEELRSLKVVRHLTKKES